MFLLATLSLGQLISTFAATQEQATNTAPFFTIPATTLSGFATPIGSMPLFFKQLDCINLLRHVVLLLRSIFLKGIRLELLWPNVLAIGVRALLLLAISDLRFRKSIALEKGQDRWSHSAVARLDLIRTSLNSRMK